jgi:RimJ/RimL family protein N-acetyltransferase
MQLLNISLDDLPLYESVHCDERMMAQLGGAWPKGRMPEKLRRDVASIENGSAWVFKIIPEDNAGHAAGTVCLWENSWRGESINEIGWMILPQFQGQGLATKAVRAMLDRARLEKRWGDAIHAFPATANAPSNAICQKMRFSLIEECDLEYAGHLLRCNHWRLDLPQSDIAANIA